MDQADELGGCAACGTPPAPACGCAGGARDADPHEARAERLRLTQLSSKAG